MPFLPGMVNLIWSKGMCSAITTGTLRASFVLVFFYALFMTHCAPPGAGMIRRDGEDHRVRTDRQDDSVQTLRFSWDNDGMSRDSGVAFYSPDENPVRLNNRQHETSLPADDRDPDNNSGKRGLSGTTKHPAAAHERKNPVTGTHPGKTETAVASLKNLRYRVRKGDTLYGLSRRYNRTIDELCDANRIKKTAPLIRGTMIVIPGAGDALASEKKPRLSSGPAEKEDRPRFTWPLNKVVRVSRDGGGGVKPIGVEITGHKNSPVVSAAPGVVKKIGEMRGYGTYIIISHGERYVTVYASVRDVRVEEGDRVGSGSVIARVDGDRRMLFQIGRSGKPVDPLGLLPKRG